MAVLAYLLYGDNKTYELEFLLSALSARVQARRDATLPGLRIVLLTDRPRFDAAFPFEQRLITPEQMKVWTSTPGRSYNHRVKVLALLEVLRHDGRGDEPLALIDTDTWFTGAPARLFERISADATVMHEQEVPHIEMDPDCKEVVDFIRPGVTIEGFAVSATSPMYNSGVVGVLPSHAPLVEQALALLDALYDRAPVFNVEQFAFGVVLSQKTRLSTCNDVVRHYWGHVRNFVHVQAARHLPQRSAQEFLEREARGELPFLGEPAKARADQFAARWRSAVHRWSDGYRFAWLAARSAWRCRASDPEIANAWAASAHEDLRRVSVDDATALPTRWREDFAVFAAPASTLPWLRGDLHAKWQLLLGAGHR